MNDTLKRDQHYRKLFDESHEAMFAVDTQTGRYLDANRAAERLTGRTAAELRTLTTRDVTPGGAEARLREVAEGSNAHDYGEVVYVRPDGTTRNALLSIVHVDDGLVVGIAHDITERRRAEDAMQALLRGTTVVGEEFFRALVRELAQAIGAMDCFVGRLVLPERECVRTLASWSRGRPGENFTYQLAGTPCARVIDRAPCYFPSGVTAMFPEDQGLVDLGVDTYLGVPLFGRDGSVTGIIVVLNDRPLQDPALAESLMRIFAARVEAELDRMDAVAEQKRVEERLRRLAAAIEQAEESVMITDPGGVIEYVNPAFERITGYPRDEAEGRHTRMLKSGRHDALFYTQLWRTITAGRPWKGRIVNRRKDGALYTEDCSITPVVGDSGRIEHYVATKRDVTAAIRMEEDLRQAQRVESVGRLAAGVAHDFNNLLSPILGYAQLLMEDLHPSDTRYAQVHEIESAARRARDLTRQLLAFGRKQTLQIKPVDLNGIVSGMERLLRRTLREDVDLRTRLHHGPCVVLADAGQAEQVLMNLVVNAQDAMPHGGTIRVEVTSVYFSPDDCEARPDATPGHYGVLVVGDSGTGMDEETRQQIFEPFFSTKGERGTGLGLSTVYGIVKQHGGHVSVESELGAGSVFQVFLPLTIDTAAADARAPVAAEYDRPQATGTVLLVEDNDAVRQLARTMLERGGYTVLAAEGGQEAIAVLERHGGPVDVLLTDVIMPGMDGRELYGRIAALQPGLKVIYMSGYTDDVMEERGLLEGGAHFVHKPFTVPGLLQKVRDVIGG